MSRRLLLLLFVFAASGCSQKGPDTYGDDAPRSSDFDPVAPPKIVIFEGTQVRKDPAPYTPRPMFDAPRPDVSKITAKPASVTRTKDQRPPTKVSLSIYREGDDLRQNQMARLESSAAPKFSVQQWVNSSPLTLTQLRGKIVVLDFWATWCQPCLRSVPHNNDLAKRYKADGVVLIGICHPQGADRMIPIAKQLGIQYPIAIDARGTTIANYRVNEYPDYYLIDRSGQLRVADCRNDSIEAAIQALLSEDQSG